MNILFFLRPKSDLAYVYDNHTLRQVLETMEYHKYSSVPVLNREGKYVGSITEGDLLWWIKDHANLDLKKAENILMTEVTRRYDYQAVNAGAKMEDLIDRAMEQNFVPVVDDQQNFIGIITSIRKPWTLTKLRSRWTSMRLRGIWRIIRRFHWNPCPMTKSSSCFISRICRKAANLVDCKNI